MSGGTPAARVAGRMAEAAAAFLASLDEGQAGLARRPFPSDVERRRWYYTPTDHGGLPLGTMRPAQHRLALRLVATGLSRPGYVTAATIMGLENVLDELEGWTADWGRERGRDPGLYYLRVFGEPGGGAPWSWRFGGHHVSIHHLVVGGEVRASTPCFLGADPAASPLLGPHLLRPLAAAEDLARDLVCALDAEQRARAVISPVAPVDLVGANRPRVGDGELPLPLAEVWRGRLAGELARRADDMQRRAEQAAGLGGDHLAALRLTREPKGLPAADLTAGQREQLRRLLDVYLGRIPAELAVREAGRYAGERLQLVWFAWAGDVEPGQPHYYRVQGPRLLLEYDNTQREVNHVHSVWRDPDGDFGDDVLLRHYAGEH
jgi:hypothetical protein